MRMMMDNVMAAISQAYSLSSCVAIIMKFWCVNTFEMMSVAMPNTTAAPQMMMHERFLRNLTEMKRLGMAKRRMSQLSNKAPTMYIAMKMNRKPMFPPRQSLRVLRAGVYFSAKSSRLLARL